MHPAPTLTLILAASLAATSRPSPNPDPQSPPPSQTYSPPATPASPPTRDGQRIRFGLVVADPALRTVSFPARVLMTNGLLEYAVVTDYGKTHESLLVTDALPMDVQAALLLLRARPSGTNALLASPVTFPPGSAIDLSVQLPTPAGTPTNIPLHSLLALSSDGPNGAITGAPTPGPWIFNGSCITPEGFGAHFDGSIIALIHDPIAILNNPGPDRHDDDIHVPNAARLPPPGTPVQVQLTLPPQPPR